MSEIIIAILWSLSILFTDIEYSDQEVEQAYFQNQAQVDLIIDNPVESQTTLNTFRDETDMEDFEASLIIWRPTGNEPIPN